MSEFEYKKYSEIKKMAIDELNKYYRDLRRYEYEKNMDLDTSTIKKRVHALTMLVLKIDRLLVGRKLVIFDDKRGDYKNIDKGKVYASSHVGRYDIESAMESIKEQCYFVMGDPGETYRDFDGFFLDKFYGRICVDTGYQEFENMQRKKRGEKVAPKDEKLIREYKTDRHICEVTCERRIKNKDNILIFPEGAWNITSRLTQPLFKGAARIAINGDGTIIPVGILKDGKRYTVNIGKPMNIEGATLSDDTDITNELKENLNSLKGEMIFAGDKITKRDSLGTPEENEKAYMDEIMSESANDYTVEAIEASRFYDKDAPENVFKALKKVR